MNKAQMMDRVMGGEIFMVCEYRSSLAEAVTMRAPEAGRPATFWRLTHNVEVGQGAMKVSERVPDGANLENYKSPFKKGTPVVCVVATILRDKAYNRVVNGVLEPLAV